MLKDKEKYKVIFAGTSEFAVPTFKQLILKSDIEVIAALTQPDRRAGRGRKFKISPVKKIAQEHNIRLLQPFELNESQELKEILANDIDFFIVVSFGLMIPRDVIKRVKFAINIHASILPRWRGASPIQQTIMNGDRYAGVSIMEITERLDAGPVYCSASLRVDYNETFGSLSPKLAKLGSDELIEIFSKIKQGQLDPKRQNEDFATYANKISKQETEINWDDEAIMIERRIRALNPSPGATSKLNGLKIKLYEVKIKNDRPALNPGEWSIDSQQKLILVGTSTETISILKIQRSGGKIMQVKDFINGIENTSSVK